MTRHLLKIFLLTAFVFAAVQSSAFAANTERVEVVNETGRTIVSLECVGVRKAWNGKDLLGGNVLRNGKYMNIKYDPQTQYFKLRIFFEDGKSVTWNKIDFNDAWRLTLYRGQDGKYKYSKNARG